MMNNCARDQSIFQIQVNIYSLLHSCGGVRKHDSVQSFTFSLGWKKQGDCNCYTLNLQLNKASTMEGKTISLRVAPTQLWMLLRNLRIAFCK